MPKVTAKYPNYQSKNSLHGTSLNLTCEDVKKVMSNTAIATPHQTVTIQRQRRMIDTCIKNQE